MSTQTVQQIQPTGGISPLVAAVKSAVEMQDQRPQPVRLEDVRQVGARIGRSKSWIHAAVKRGEFPAASRISVRCTRWKSTDIDQWIEAQFLGEGAK